jgi:competence protein ComFC
MTEACCRCATPWVSATCVFCKQHPDWPITTCTAIFQYAFPIKQWLQQFKFYGHLQYARPFGWCLDRATIKADYCLPMPADGQRLKQRGYHHVLELLRCSSVQSVQRSVLLKRTAPPQVGQNKMERFKNLKHVFYLHHALPESVQSVMLVDDVMTSGSSLYHSAKVLKQHYPKLVIHALVLARD